MSGRSRVRFVSSTKVESIKARSRFSSNSEDKSRFACDLRLLGFFLSRKMDSRSLDREPVLRLSVLGLVNLVENSPVVEKSLLSFGPAAENAVDGK